MLERKKQSYQLDSALEERPIQKARDTSHFGLIDWDFKSETSRSYIHDICWYPSRFIPVIPAQLISSLSSRNDTVLDPFCGAGTTSVEALKAGRNAIAVDLSPIACYLTEVKSSLLLIEKQNVQQLSDLHERLVASQPGDAGYPQLFNSSAANIREHQQAKLVPNFAENKGWYHPRTLAELACIFRHVEDLPSGLLQELARILFISILMAATGHRTGRSYTYYADNVKPKNKLIYKNAIELYCKKLDRFLRQYTTTTLRAEPSLTSQVFECNVSNMEKVVDVECDLIITSPPYLGVTDYATGFRLAYLWYDFVSDLSNLKADEIGARYRRHRSTTKVLEEYKRDLDVATCQMVRALKRRGYLCLVLGEPLRYYLEVRKFVVELLEVRYRLILQDSFTRQISKNFFLHPRGGVKTEEILIFRRN